MGQASLKQLPVSSKSGIKLSSPRTGPSILRCDPSGKRFVFQGRRLYYSTIGAGGCIYSNAIFSILMVDSLIWKKLRIKYFVYTDVDFC